MLPYCWVSQGVDPTYKRTKFQVLDARLGYRWSPLEHRVYGGLGAFFAVGIGHSH